MQSCAVLAKAFYSVTKTTFHISRATLWRQTILLESLRKLRSVLDIEGYLSGFERKNFGKYVKIPFTFWDKHFEKEWLSNFPNASPGEQFKQLFVTTPVFLIEFQTFSKMFPKLDKKNRHWSQNDILRVQMAVSWGKNYYKNFLFRISFGTWAKLFRRWLKEKVWAGFSGMNFLCPDEHFETTNIPEKVVYFLIFRTLSKTFGKFGKRNNRVVVKFSIDLSRGTFYILMDFINSL